MTIEDDDFRRLADALLASLTREEKLGLLHQHTAPVPRLGIGAFHTGAEALHGVAWVGVATHFPQPVALAATWDPGLVERVGAVVGTEVLAMRAAGVEISRNVWAPVVNPLRHPRWGRNEEGYSEDPNLTAELAGAYAFGMRGRDASGWRVVPTLKHFAGYSNETDRAVSSSQLPPRVFHEYELPAFAGPARAGAVGAVMLSYNLINGRPAHLCADLIGELQDAAAAELLVVSDAYAPLNLWQCERYYPDRATAYAAALRAGLDSFTVDDANSAPTLEALRAAHDQGLISDAEIDRAAGRVLLARARAGEFGDDPFAGTGVMDAPGHRALAREAAGRGVVVLANDGVLPLSLGASTREALRAGAPGLTPTAGRVVDGSPAQGSPSDEGEPSVDRGVRSVAVVGQLADRVLHDWYSGTPPYVVTVADAVRELGAAVAVADGSDRIALRVPASGRYLVAAADRALLASGLTAEPWDVTDWGHGVCTLASADSGLLWTAAQDGAISASAKAPGEWVVQESFRLHRFDDGTVSVQHLATGRWLRVEVYGGRVVAGADTVEDAARFALEVVRTGIDAAVEAATASDVVLCVVGNEPHLLGRETLDRPDLALPASMAELFAAVRAAGPRAVLVIVSSYPYVLDEAARGASAIVWTGHAGQEQGHGIVDVLTGAVEPSGRLAQTWWRDEADAGDLFEYDIQGASMTYWYSDAEPLFAFGHGLTYSSVAYRALSAAASPAVADAPDSGVGAGSVEVSVTVENTGGREATEVVQVYTSAPDHRLRVPRRLGGHARVRLAPGETTTVRITVPADRFAVWDVAGERLVVEAGEYVLSTGPDVAHPALVASVRLDGEVHAGRSLPLAAVAFDAAQGVRLEEETLATGTVATAPSGEGSLEFFDVKRLVSGLVARVARTEPGAASVEVRVRASGSEWSQPVVAEVPDGLGRHDVAEVPLAGPDLPSEGDVRVLLRGPVRLAGLTRPVDG